MDVNKIYNQDCIEFMKTLPDKYIDVCITDPPYGISINKMNFVKSGAIKVGGAYRNDYTTCSTDWDSQGLSKEQFAEIRRVSKNQIIFGANHFSNILPSSRCWVVWDKRTNKIYNNDFADCELIWTSFDKPSRIIRYLWSGMLQENMKEKEERYHPTQKPIAVMRDLICMFTKKNEIVLDPFAGVGSTLIACNQLNRNWIGCELNQTYFNIASNRLNKEMTQPKVIDWFN